MKLPIVLILAAGALVAQTPATHSPNVARPSKGTDGAARREQAKALKGRKCMKSVKF
jgi:hypothetical protein